MINIPQRLQVINGLSAFGAGLRLLALALCIPLGSLVSVTLVTKKRVPPLYILVAAGILQIVGLALMGSLPVTGMDVQAKQYIYQVILGLGIGLTLSSLLIAAPTVIQEKDLGKDVPFSSIRNNDPSYIYRYHVATANAWRKHRDRCLHQHIANKGQSLFGISHARTSPCYTESRADNCGFVDRVASRRTKAVGGRLQRGDEVSYCICGRRIVVNPLPN